MRVLALDTTTRAGSVAVLDGHATLVERAGDEARGHAERLPGEALDALAACGLRVEDVDLFAVASGPGSFTGLRIGIATIQGLAFVRQRPVEAVSALEALGYVGARLPRDPAGAARPDREGLLVAAVMDARRHEVFSALYEAAPSESPDAPRLLELEAPSVGAPAAALDRWSRWLADRDVLFIGDGAELYAEVLQGTASRSVRVAGAPLLAAAIARMAAGRLAAGTGSGPAAVQPLYVRRPDAELARDAARAGAAAAPRAGGTG
ncbi:MAG TPA: tRNA (adenosine(37)-N6)-threonylcarbamoyltransferase complex dimerization subunit type 1 TsaB [Vicinamibacterales bacterium]|jgi:tRNA threonylcarbamoyladenosine biosynthesis protein TsaB|nr:tRNA (adenosine(37)-N6)-threonylcarbamoyltransferase complex dimerization subunit type 1 TsaB [Vicinamibacterales bacterium]